MYVKILVCLAVLQVCLTATVNNERKVEDEQKQLIRTDVSDPNLQTLFKKFFARFPKVLRRGYPKQHIPSHDPWKNASVLTEFQPYYSYYQYVHTNLKDIVFSGISKFESKMFGLTWDYYDPGQIAINYMSTVRNLHIKGKIEGSGCQKGVNRTDFSGDFELKAGGFTRNATFAAWIVNGKWAIYDVSENWNNLFDFQPTINLPPGQTNDYIRQMNSTIFYYLAKQELKAQVPLAQALLEKLQAGTEDTDEIPEKPE